MNAKNQQLDSMLKAAKERLKLHVPEEIAENAGVAVSGGNFVINSLGREIHVNMQEFETVPALSHWHMLTLLHYLDIADGTKISGKGMPFSGYRDGMVRGGGFDRDAESIIQDRISSMNEKQLRERCLALGAEIMPTNADLCAMFHFAPRYPLWLKVWFADEEFPASGRLFVDENAGHYLSIEDAVTVGMLLFEQLFEE